MSSPTTSNQSATTTPLRVAVIGCGAMTRDYHLPVLAGHPGVRITALVDRDLARAQKMAAEYGIPATFTSDEEISRDLADAALIATPPVHHAPGAIAMARKGLHVFVEKPMAFNLDLAREMVRVADEAGVILAVGLFRRLLPSTRLMRGLVESQMLGPVRAFDVNEGSIYGWPAATLGNMRRDLAGGGVLIDVGTHAIDRLLHILPGRVSLVSYQDNSYGGAESDCRARLRIERAEGVLEGPLELSRTRRLRNTVQVFCERGILEVSSGNRFEVMVRPNEASVTDSLTGVTRPYKITATWTDEPDRPGFESFRVEIDDWLEAITHRRPPVLSGTSALATVELIDACYRSATRLSEPGITEALPAPERPALDIPGPRAIEKTRVLLTGATGFIGARVAEILSLSEGFDVRAVVHNPANASRLARLPVDMTMADLGSDSELARLVDGCQAVVHCAIGTSWGSRSAIFKVTVDGSKRLAEAALRAGVPRFVYLSSIAIHGSDVSGVIDENTAINPPRGDDYSESKAAAEHAILEVAARGLPTVVLRPGNVYGPFSFTFTMRPVQRLMNDELVIVDADTPSNTVFVDNIVDAILCGLRAPAVTGGEVFTISDGDDLSWKDFYEYFAAPLGKRVQTLTMEEWMRHSANKRDVKKPGWGGATFGLATSPEAKSLARRFLETDPIGRMPRTMMDRFPQIERTLRKRLRMDSPLVYERPGASQSFTPVLPRPAAIRVDKARARLGYGPAVSRADALARTLAWVRYALVNNPSGSST